MHRANLLPSLPGGCYLYSLLPLTTRRKVKAMIVRTVAALCSSQRQEGQWWFGHTELALSQSGRSCCNGDTHADTHPPTHPPGQCHP
jgi:hypothetical protein